LLPIRGARGLLALDQVLTQLMENL
jgi:hypothetical protein